MLTPLRLLAPALFCGLLAAPLCAQPSNRDADARAVVLALLQQEADRLDAEHAALAAQRRALAREIDRLVADRDRLHRERAQLEAQRGRIATDTATLRAAIAAYTAGAARYDAQRRAAAPGDHRRLEAELARLTAEHTRLDTEQQRIAAETSAMATTTARLDGEITRLITERRRLAAEQARLLAEHDRLANYEARLLLEHADLFRGRGRQAREGRRLRDAIQDAHRPDRLPVPPRRQPRRHTATHSFPSAPAASEAVERLTTERDGYAATVSSLRRERDAMAERVGMLQAEAARLAAERERLAADHALLLQERDALHREAERLRDPALQTTPEPSSPRSWTPDPSEGQPDRLRASLPVFDFARLQNAGAVRRLLTMPVTADGGGDVLVLFVTDATGAVVQTEVAQPSGDALDAHAEALVREMRFIPAVVDGEPTVLRSQVLVRYAR